mgnify:FL=1
MLQVYRGWKGNGSIKLDRFGRMPHPPFLVLTQEKEAKESQGAKGRRAKFDGYASSMTIRDIPVFVDQQDGEMTVGK